MARARRTSERFQRSLDALDRGQRPIVIDERSDRQQVRELAHAAVVIRVEVRDEQDVDSRHARRPRSGQDAVHVAPPRGLARHGRARSGRAPPPGVDQQRFTARRHDERGLAAFDVDEVDVERPRRAREDRGGQRTEDQQRGERHERIFIWSR
jgi:hypothetical protein